MIASVVTGPTRPFDELEAILGWKFSSPSLLATALTHSTYANEHPQEGPDYERLEFVGDAALGLLTAHILYAGLADAPEGELSRRRARVVRRDTLAVLARELSLGDFVRLGEGQRGSGTSARILADTFEAVVGAVYLDGGFDAVVRCFRPQIESAVDKTNSPLDFKTRLQEACHQLRMTPPTYVVVTVEGPDHARVFTSEVRIDGEARGTGVGPSKKVAEQQCAKLALENLGIRLT